MVYDKVLDYCTKQKLSIASFEEQCGISNGTIGKWKDDKSQPSISTLKKIEGFTGIPVIYWINN